jgi:hypothetical protein
MITEKRPRGRPRGSGKNDLPQLAQVADLLVRDPSLKPTTAMKRVMRGRKDWDATDSTLLRRWQVKWKANGAGLRATAREAARRQQAVASYRVPESAWMHVIKALENSPLTKMIRAMENSAMMQAMKAAENSPVMKMIRETDNSPLMQAMKSISQAHKSFEDLARSPALTEAAKALKDLPAITEAVKNFGRIANPPEITEAAKALMDYGSSLKISEAVKALK